jgi:hypothetical protein
MLRKNVYLHAIYEPFSIFSIQKLGIAIVPLTSVCIEWPQVQTIIYATHHPTNMQLGQLYQGPSSICITMKALDGNRSLKGVYEM